MLDTEDYTAFCRAIDADVARRVMGFRWWAHGFPTPIRYLATDKSIRRTWAKDSIGVHVRPATGDEPMARDWLRFVPPYATSIENAMQVLCKARKMGRNGARPRDFMIASNTREDGYVCEFYVGPGNWVRSEGATISEAICQAATALSRAELATNETLR